MNLKGYSGIFFVVVGLIAIIAYVLESKITQDAYSYVWLMLIGIVSLVYGYYLYTQR